MLLGTRSCHILFASLTPLFLARFPLPSQAVVIDPVDTMAERDSQMVTEMGLKPTLLLNTHVHADHITGTGKLKTLLPGGAKSGLSEASGGQADVKIQDGEKIRFGSRSVRPCFPPTTVVGVQD